MLLSNNDSVSTLNKFNEELEEEVELEFQRAVVELPVNTIEAMIQAVVYIDGSLETVTCTLNMEDVRKAFRRGEDCIEDDEIWQLTDKGREYIENNPL